MAGFDFGAFAGGLNSAVQEDPLTKLLKQQMMQPAPQPPPQVETEGGGLQLREPQQQGGGKFGTLRDLMTRLTSGLGG